MANVFEKFQKLFVFSIVSTIVLGTTIFSIVVAHDYIFITLNNILENMITAGTIPAIFTGVFEGFINSLVQIIGLLDYLWAGIFIALVYEVGFFCYNAKREGYFNIFGFLSFGIMIFLFIGSIFETITGYLYNIFFNAILQNVTIKLTFFSFYITNFIIINLLIVCVCIFLNFVDFDNVTFFSRKDKETIKDDGTTEL